MKIIVLISILGLLAGCSRKTTETATLSVDEHSDTVSRVTTLHEASQLTTVGRDSTWTATHRTIIVHEKETLRLGGKGDTLDCVRDREVTDMTETGRCESYMREENSKQGRQSKDSLTVSGTDSSKEETSKKEVEKNTVATIVEGRDELKATVAWILALLAVVTVLILVVRKT